MAAEQIIEGVPAVSVIVAGGSTLEEAEAVIERLACQTLDALQIVYATSDSDCARQLEEEYDGPSSSVKVVQVNNNAYESCFNAGLKMATGEYVAFLYDDVLFEDNAWQAAYNKAHKLDADIVLINENHHVEGANRYIASFRQLSINMCPNAECFSCDDLGDRMLLVASGSIQSKLFRRSFIYEHGIGFEEADTRSAVQVTYVCQALAKRVCVLDRCLVHLPEDYAYRTDAFDVVSFYDGLYTKLQRYGVFDKVAWGLIDLFLEDCICTSLSSSRESLHECIQYIIEKSSFYLDVVCHKDVNDNGVLDQDKLRYFMQLAERCNEAPYADEQADSLTQTTMRERIVVIETDSLALDWSAQCGDGAHDGLRAVAYLKPYAIPTDKEYSEQRGAGKESLARWRPYATAYSLKPDHDERLHVVLYINSANMSLVDVEPLIWLRARYQHNVVTYAVLTDSVESLFEDGKTPFDEFVRHFDYVATTDSLDARTYDLVPSLMPCVKASVPAGDAYASDIYFHGDAGAYEQVLLDIARRADSLGVRANLNIAHMQTRGERMRGVHRLSAAYASQPYDARGLVGSSCLLDVSEQSGNSLPRAYYNAIVQNKKLLTNNRKVLSAPFYDPQNMRVFASVDDIDFAWVLESVECAYGYDGRFQADVILNSLVDECHGMPSRFEQTHSSEPLVSVILPTYNRAHTIVRAVESVLAQSYAKLELIVVDDGSTDNTVELLGTIDDDRLRVVRTSNGGACAARNKGVEYAAGELVAFQDSDDEWLPHKLQMQVEALRAHPGASVVFCNALRIEDANEVVIRHLVPQRISRIMSKQNMQARSLASTQTLLMKRECLDTERFDVGMRRLQDFDLVFRLAEHYAFYYVSVPLVYMYVQEESISSDPQKTIDARRQMIDKYQDIMEADLLVYEGMLGSIHSNNVMLGIEDAQTRRSLRYVRQLKSERNKSSDLASLLGKLRERVKSLQERTNKQRAAIEKRDNVISRQKEAIARLDRRVEQDAKTIAQLRKDLKEAQSSLAHKIARRLKRS